MRKILLILFLLGGVIAKGQTPPYNYQISQQPLPIVNNVFANYTGGSGRGTTTYYYVVVARYGVGNAAPGNGYAVNNIDGTGSVSIGWGAPANPSGYQLTYDVLRLTTPQFPASGSCTNCLVSSANSTNPVTDSLGALGSYTLSTYNPFPANGVMTLDNIDQSYVSFLVNLNGSNILFGGLNGCGLVNGNNKILPNAQTNNYAIQLSDCGKVVGPVATAAMGYTYTLFGTSASTVGFYVFVFNPSSYSLTVTSSNVFVGSGASGMSLTVAAGTNVELISTSNSWIVLSGGGGGGSGSCPASGAAGTVQGTNGSTACESTSITDNGTTVSTTEPLAALSVSTGSSPPSSSVCTTTGTMWCAGEGAAPTGTLLAVDSMWPDATAHRFKMNNNDGGAVQVVASGADINTSDQVTGGTHLTSGTVTVNGTSCTFNSTCYTPVLQNPQSAAYTTVLGDAGKQILHPASDNNARTFTIDSNANVAYAIGTTLTFVNLVNTLTIAITSDTLTWGANTGSRTLAAGSTATALKVGTTQWIINGGPGLT